MAQLLLAAVLLAAIVVFVRWLMNANPASLAAAVRRTAWIGLGIGGLGLLGLLVTRNPSFALGLLFFLAPLLLQLVRQWRAGGMLGGGWRTPGRAASDRSEIATLWLRMTLEHESGDMQGRVLAGRFAGRQLGDLTEQELTALLAECASDPDSARLLETYLDRRLGPDWRQHRAGTGQRGSDRVRDTDMSVAEAWDVLGLKPGATPDEIRAAHRRLMQTVHPDRGGSDHLAARVNRAKDILLPS